MNPPTTRFSAIRVLACAITLTLSPCVALAGEDVDLLVRRVTEQRATPSAKTVEKVLSTQRADGSWPDVQYAGTSYMGWEALTHLARLTDLASAANGASPTDRPKFVDAFHRGCAYWLAHPLTSKNWWNNEIGLPDRVSLAMVLLKPDLNDAERAWCKQLLVRKHSAMTGQNLVWNLAIDLQCALVLDDDATVGKCLDGIFAEVTDERKEGIQPDASFHQHGPQHQFGNYGQAFADSTSRWMELVRGTKFDARLSDAQRTLFRRFVTEGLANIVWKGTMDLAACGRQIRHDGGVIGTSGGSGPREKARGTTSVLKRMLRIDPDHAADYQASLESNTAGGTNRIVGDRAFYRSDLNVHRTPSFYASVRMHSPRVTPSEQSAQENLLGQFIADGTMSLMRSGNEYANVYAVWDWRKLPGTTAPQKAGEPGGANKIEKTASDFVGVISDGVDGASVFDLVRKSQRGRQSYFFCGDVIVCLGAGISSDEDAELVTTLNQCLTDGIAKRTELDGKLACVDHAGLRYLPLGETKIDLAVGDRTGNWQRVERFDNTPKEDVTMNVTTLTISHGTKPKDARYAYAILGGDDATAGTLATSLGQVSLIANEPARQIVAFPASKKTMATLFEPGTFALPDGTAVEASRPCEIIIDQSTDHVRVTVTDPTQKLDAIDISIGGKKQTIALPQGRLAGSGAKAEW